jgi:hypothetical protein
MTASVIASRRSTRLTPESTSTTTGIPRRAPGRRGERGVGVVPVEVQDAPGGDERAVELVDGERERGRAVHEDGALARVAIDQDHAH